LRLQFIPEKVSRLRPDERTGAVMSEIAETVKVPIRRSLQAMQERLRLILPGLAVAILVAMSAVFVTEHHGGPVMLMALLLGMAVGFLREDPRLQPGLTFTSKSVLRLGVALLGGQITIQYLTDLGGAALSLVVAGVVLTIVSGIGLARLLGRSSWFGVLAGGAVGICGASAAAALSAVLPRHETSDADTAMTIIGVTALSTIAMIAYPVIGRAVGLDDQGIGFFLGVTIHDVAQVVGAGYSVSDLAGNVAVVVKLFRVLLLLPVVVIVAFAVRMTVSRAGAARPTLPAFVVGFAALVALGSLGLIPSQAASYLSGTSRWCLVIAMAGIGINTSLGQIRQLGYRPAVVLVGSTVAIAVVGLAAALLLFAPAR
jgi:uncharacterized integral membrane protein (TIGR00698 family)